MYSKNKCLGFTLIELLVVISIIALLLSILMPALAKVKDQGQRTVCMANLRTTITAWCAYSADNKDNLVGGLPGVSGRTSSQQLSVYQYAWVEIPQDAQGNFTGGVPDATFNYTDASMEDEIRGIEKGLLYKYIGDIKPYRCASDPRSKSKEAWRSYTIAAGMNIDYPSYNNSYYVNNSTKMSQVKSPSKKYVFVENRDARGWNMGFWDLLAPSRMRAEWWNVVAGWHKKNSNWAFSDGHTETQLWRDKRTIDICTELDYAKQVSMRRPCSVKNEDLGWIVDCRMNKW
jgi:prepilin-type N-terminal cleavage/methylation domain-containing protein